MVGFGSTSSVDGRERERGREREGSNATGQLRCRPREESVEKP